MKKQWIVFTAAFLMLSSIIIAQTQTTTGVIGKLYTKDQANQIYGPVLQSISINTTSLSALAAKTPNYIMFNILNGQVVILNSYRSVLYGPMTAVSASQVFRVFSTSIVNQLIQQGGSPTTNIELRANNTLTVSNGEETLEMSYTCPPICPSN